MKRIFFALFVLSLLAGCDGPLGEVLPGQDENDEISGEFCGDLILNLGENYLHNEYLAKPGLYVQIRTATIYPYMGNLIENKVSLTGNTLSIQLGAVITCGMLCATGPATLSVELPAHIDRIVVSSAGREDIYGVDISETGMRLTADQPLFTRFEHDLYHRRPANSFAFIGGTNIGNTALYHEFLACLQAAIPSLEAFSFRQEGSLPWPEASDGHWVDFPTQFFRYSDPADFDKAGQVLRDFTRQKIVYDKIGVGFWLSNFDGRQYMSWLMFN